MRRKGGHKRHFSSCQFCIGKIPGEAEGMIQRSSKQNPIQGLEGRTREKTPQSLTSVPGTTLETNSKPYHICPYATISKKERVNVDFK